MALTLDNVKATFNALVARDVSLTDAFVDKVARASQMKIIAEGYFSFTLDASEKKITTSATDTGEYNLDTLNPSWKLRKIKTLRRIETVDGKGGKLEEISFRESRSIYPDPLSTPGRKEPTMYYVKDNGKTVGLIPIPDSVYDIYIDFYKFPEDPIISGNFLIPEEHEFVLAYKIAELWYDSIDQTDRANSKFVKYMKEIEILKDNNREPSEDVRKKISPYGTNTIGRSNSIFTRKQISDSL